MRNINVIAVIVATLLPTLAFGQQTSPQEQIERTIGSLYVSNINLGAQLQQEQSANADLRKQLAEAQAKLKELEMKAAAPAGK